MLRPYTLPSEEDGRQIALDALASAIHYRASAMARAVFTELTGETASNSIMRKRAYEYGDDGMYHRLHADAVGEIVTGLLDAPDKVDRINRYGLPGPAGGLR